MANGPDHDTSPGSGCKCIAYDDSNGGTGYACDLTHSEIAEIFSEQGQTDLSVQFKSSNCLITRRYLRVRHFQTSLFQPPFIVKRFGKEKAKKDWANIADFLTILARNFDSQHDHNRILHRGSCRLAFGEAYNNTGATTG